MENSKFAIIGGGNIGRSLASGLISSNRVSPQNIHVTKRNLNLLLPLKEKGVIVSSDNCIAVADANIVVLAVLPQQFDQVIEPLIPILNTEKHIVISVISGVNIEDIETKLPGISVLRAMPNTAIAIGESMTCIAANKNSEKHLGLLTEIFDTVGTTLTINEEHMTAATALCACGIAFFLRAIRAASQGGIEIGFHADEALQMAAQTAKGAASLLVHHEKHPEREIDKVTSPEGCTIAGLNEMEHQGFSSAMIKGIITSSNKAGGLYKQD